SSPRPVRRSECLTVHHHGPTLSPLAVVGTGRRDGESMPYPSATDVKAAAEPIGTRGVLVDETGSELESLWVRLLRALEANVQPTALESWLRPCRLAAVDHDHLRVAAPRGVVSRWGAPHHPPPPPGAARAGLGRDPAV